MSKRMKTFRNEQHGFEIDIPDEWLLAPIPSGSTKEFFQFGNPNEAFNFVIGPLIPERLLERTELEFRLYAQSKNYINLEFGRITVGGKEHVWARYLIQDAMGNKWNKKYMIVFGTTEYSITATCNDPQWFSQREKFWDSIVRSFRLMESRQEDNQKLQARRGKIAGSLYEQAYEAVSKGRYSEARDLLEKCLTENPDHMLAHKELAVVLRQLGDVKGALAHRREVKRLASSDTLNRLNMSVLLDVLGARDEALQEVEELLQMVPNNREGQALKTRLLNNHFNLSYPQHYEQESKLVPGKKCNLKLIYSTVEASKYITLIRLIYQWNTTLSYEEAFRLDRRTRAYITCAVYDAAKSAGLFCQPSETPYGRRPAWFVEGEKTAISLINAAFELSESNCLLEIGPTVREVRAQQKSGVYWEKLLDGFKNKFSSINV
ncbi:MAG: hypothetical protein DWQ04_20800 [Chloroflexi bacterium]|nr:MAG: hypothetical protein DWQ04_20800 [Chloroflexota bacterium]